MRNIKNYVYIVLFIFAVTMQSCREDEVEIVELDRAKYTSYEDLFVSFWDTMSNNYNYHAEGVNWDDIYREFAPKFKALKTFEDKNADPDLAEKEIERAFSYFADIVSNNVKDEHFSLTVSIKNPAISSLSETRKEVFRSTIPYTYSEEAGYSRVEPKGNNHPVINSFYQNNSIIPKLETKGLYNSKPILSGVLKTDPDVRYLGIKTFSIGLKIINPSLFTEIKQPSSDLNVSEKLYSELKKIDPVAEKGIREAINKNIAEYRKAVDEVISSDVYKAYIDAVKTFKETENVDKLVAVKDPLATLFNEKASYKTIESPQILSSRISAKYISGKNKKALENVKESYMRMRIAMDRSSGLFIESQYNFTNISKILNVELFSSAKEAEFYKDVLNPLAEGKFKKLILDLRGNGGGDITDTRDFISRLIAKPTVYGYQRTKEGDGRFNYTPWVENEVDPHKFGLKKQIPVIILTDRGSASMSEITTMMLKAQGNAKSVGDYTSGATAGLKNNNDILNGGYIGKNKYLEFRMPLMAFKDINGNVIEGIGIAPDIKVIPTQEEVNNMRTTLIDPAFDRALVEIRKMN